MIFLLSYFIETESFYSWVLVHLAMVVQDTHQCFLLIHIWIHAGNVSACWMSTFWYLHGWNDSGGNHGTWARGEVRVSSKRSPCTDYNNNNKLKNKTLLYTVKDTNTLLTIWSILPEGEIQEIMSRFPFSLISPSSRREYKLQWFCSGFELYWLSIHNEHSFLKHSTAKVALLTISDA